MCISDRAPDPPPTMKTNTLLYISSGVSLVKAVGSSINEAGNLSITFCNIFGK